MVSCFGIQKPRIPRYSIECLYLGHTLTSSVLFTVHQGSGGMSNISTKKFFLLVSLMLAQYGNQEPVVVTYNLKNILTHSYFEYNATLRQFIAKKSFHYQYFQSVNFSR